MNLWHIVESYVGMPGTYQWAVVAFSLTCFLMLGNPEARPRARMALIFFALALTGLFSAAFFEHFYGESSIASHWLRWSSIFIQFVALTNLAAILLFDVVFRMFNFRPPGLLRDLILAAAYIVGVFAVLSRSGVDLAGIVATSAVMTAVIGFSLQDTLGNVMGGMVLQMERTINVGDWIRVDQLEGRVMEIRWRQTSIETRNWDTVVVPNSQLMKAQVVLLGRRSGEPRQHRMWVYFHVDFRYAPSHVIDVVEAALRAEPIANIAATPPPNCILMDFKESYASYAVRYWLTDMGPDDPTQSTVRSRIWFALRRAEIPMSIPAASLFVTEDKVKRRERKLHEEMDHRQEALQRIELFNTLTDAERQELAQHLHVAPFVRGEAITRQGGEAHHLYIMTRGEAEVRVSSDGSELSQRVATLKAGDFFGEMSIMTGAPRRATTIALSDVECYRLEKTAFHEILKRRPKLAEDISHVLARRAVELEAVKEGLNEEAKKRRVQSAQSDFLHRITQFFKIGDHKTN
jgi:small-conductance mechanosensitive channel/CRP-like cAMP-binding protein